MRLHILFAALAAVLLVYLGNLLGFTLRLSIGVLHHGVELLYSRMRPDLYRIEHATLATAQHFNHPSIFHVAI